MPTFQKSLLLTVQLAGHLAYMVLIPIVIFGGLGLIADRRFGTTPLYILIGIGAAFVSTLYWMKVRLREIIISILKEPWTKVLPDKD